MGNNDFSSTYGMKPKALDPNDPGIGREVPVPIRTTPIKMMIGDWYTDEFGNQCREITAA